MMGVRGMSPWISIREAPFWIHTCAKILERKRVVVKLLRKWRYSKSESAFNLYKRFRNRVTNELKKSKKSYFQNYFRENKYSMKSYGMG